MRGSFSVLRENGRWFGLGLIQGTSLFPGRKSATSPSLKKRLENKNATRN
jgi:hypothetical protein